MGGAQVTAENNNRWISVEEEQKPKLREPCLCVCSYGDDHEWDFMMVLKWMGNCDNGLVNRPHFQDEGTYGMHVTHWMHLPELPNGKHVNTNGES